MTDQETFTAMLDRAGVVWHLTGPGVQETRPPGEDHDIQIRAKEGPANVGYDGFVVEASFTADGALKAIGAWE